MDNPELGALVSNPDEVREGTAALQPSIPDEIDESNPLVTIPMSEEQCSEWLKRIAASDERIKREGEVWKLLLDAYIPKPKKAGEAEDVNTNAHFRNVQTKLGQMFIAAPEVRCEPAPCSPADNAKPGMTPGTFIALGDVVPIKQEILNKRLGRDGIKVNRLFDELIFDVLAWTGIGCSKLGYKSVSQDIDQPVMQPNPNFIPQQPAGNVLGLSPTPQAPMVPVIDPVTGQPKTEKVSVVVFDEIYWRRFSSLKLVTDALLYSTRHDEDATLMGMRFSMLPSQAASAFGLEEAELTGTTDDYRYKHGKDNDDSPQVITGVEIYYKAPFYLHGEVHPQKLIQLVFLDHIKDRPVVHRPCVDQTFNEKGELTDDSIDRFPIRVLTIRDLADSQFPPSDSAFTQNLVKQLNTNRRQGIALRDAAIGKVLYDSGALEDGDVEKVKNAKPGDWIAVAEGKLEKGTQAVAAPIAQVTRTQDDYRLDAMLQQNMDETLGISANSSGASEDTVRSATEINTIQRAVQGRNQKEQGRVIDHFLDGVRLIDILISRYTTEEQWVKITGEQGQSIMRAWTGAMVSGRWLYNIAPDSQLQVDTAVDRQQNLSFYNLVAKDPLVNRTEILKRLSRQFGYDPAKIVLNPAQQQAQPPHGGTGEAVNDHEAAKTGGRENAPK